MKWLLSLMASLLAVGTIGVDAQACQRCRRPVCCCPRPTVGTATVPPAAGTLQGAPTPAVGSGMASATASGTAAGGTLTTLQGAPDRSATVGESVTGPGSNGVAVPKPLLNTNDAVAAETWKQLAIAQAKIRKDKDLPALFDLRKSSLLTETGSLKTVPKGDPAYEQLLNVDAVTEEWNSP